MCGFLKFKVFRVKVFRVKVFRVKVFKFKVFKFKVVAQAATGPLLFLSRQKK